MKDNALRLLNDVRAQLEQYGIANSERFEANVKAFLNQCPDDRILQDAKVLWDGKEEFDFLWDTHRFDCRFSIGLDDTSWHLWTGVNTHSEDDECYQHGIGGMDIDGYEERFAYIFYESMGWEIKDLY